MGEAIKINDVSHYGTKNRNTLEVKKNDGSYSLLLLCFLLVALGSLGPVGRLGNLYFLRLLGVLDVLCCRLALVSSGDYQRERERDRERVRTLRVGRRLFF